MHHTRFLALFNMPGGAEWLLIIGLLLLLFGRRMPDVARSLGRSIVEFKKGIREINNEVEESSRLEDARPRRDSKRLGTEDSRPQEESESKT